MQKCLYPMKAIPPTFTAPTFAAELGGNAFAKARPAPGQLPEIPWRTLSLKVASSRLPNRFITLLPDYK
jgi:hypothetical protein